MYVYRVELNYSEDNSSSMLEYDTEESAINAAIDNIISQISCWGQNHSSEEIDIYNEIVNYIQNGIYVRAIDTYNSIPDDLPDHQDDHVYIFVNKCQVISYPKIRYTISPIIPDDEDDESSKVEVNVTPVVKEQPCVHCGRMNDVGMIVCWYCGNKPG